MQSQADLTTEIKTMFLEVSNLPGMTIDDIDTNKSLFQDGLGLDSVDVLEFVVRLDRKYGLKIRNSDEGRKVLANISSIVEAVAQQTRG